MKYSNIALKVLAAHATGFIKSRAQFAKDIIDGETLERLVDGHDEINEMMQQLTKKFENTIDEKFEQGFVCTFDPEFPVVISKTNGGDKPFLLFYKGNINLLNDLNSIIAVIGVLNPEIEVIKREKAVVDRLVQKGLIILSGLAKGCDSVSHETALENGGKTIAVLPSTLENIYPAENRHLADRILHSGGLLVTEYYAEPVSRFDATKRFTDRDRLQAMFSKAIILSASYRKDEGDSGSRHAMEFSKKIGTNRYMIFNENTDCNDPQYGLNYDYFCTEKDVEILTPQVINQIAELHNPSLERSGENNQLSFM